MHSQEIFQEWDRMETQQALAALLRGDSDAAADSLGRMTWALLATLARESGCPTEGPLAWAIWRKANSEGDAKTAIVAMSHCGYMPFQGYPLARQTCAIRIERSELTCADGSLIVTYSFQNDLPHHLRRRAYEQALARLKAEWPDTSCISVATTGQGYSAHRPARVLPCSCNLMPDHP
jgi:hypothetical protein